MRATIFDRPLVINLARQKLAEEGLTDRVAMAEGDFYADVLPGGHDLALLSAIIHQNGPEQNVELYRKVFDALVPGGAIAIRDFVMSEDHTEPADGASFAINMLVNTPGGSTYSFRDISRDLEAAGFVDAEGCGVLPDEGEFARVSPELQHGPVDRGGPVNRGALQTCSSTTSLSASW